MKIKQRVMAGIVWLIALCAGVPIAASPEHGVVIQGEHRTRVKDLALAGDYEEAISLLISHPAEAESASFQDSAFSLARASELLIALDNKTIYQKYMPGLEPLRAEVDEASPKHKRQVALKEEAIELHDYCKRAFAKIGEKAYRPKEIMALIENEPQLTQEKLAQLIEKIVTINDNVEVGDLAKALAGQIEGYKSLDTKYKEVFALGMLIDHLRAPNPLRARVFAQQLMDGLVSQRFDVAKELNPIQADAFKDTVRTAKQVIHESFWRGRIDVKVASDELRETLIGLVTAFELAVAKGDTVAAGLLVHPDAADRDSILKAIDELDIESLDYSEFHSFVISPDGGSVTAECKVKLIQKNQADPDIGEKTILFLQKGEQWLIARI